MAVNTCEECQHSYSISISPEEVSNEPLFESLLTFSGYSGNDNQIQGQMCLDDQMNCENNVALPMGKIDTYRHCVLDMGIGNGDTRMVMNNSDNMEKLKIDEMFKNETPLKRVLQRQISLPVGEKIVNLLMNERFALPKSKCTDEISPEKMHESSACRSRKHKRSTSFGSRNVVILFSVLSSLGTMVLIYLTLRERQLGYNISGSDTR